MALEISRLREQLNRLASSVDDMPTAKALPQGSNDRQSVSVELHPGLLKQLRSISRARARRADFLPSHLFADPAWDMLLELFQCELSQVRISVSSLCAAAQVPATTALRWIGNLEHEKLIYRRADPFDRRRVYVGLTDYTILALTNYFKVLTPPDGV